MSTVQDCNEKHVMWLKRDCEYGYYDYEDDISHAFRNLEQVFSQEQGTNEDQHYLELMRVVEQAPETTLGPKSEEAYLQYCTLIERAIEELDRRLEEKLPFHKSIISAIEIASLSDLQCLAPLIKATTIPKDHEQIMDAWKEACEDYSDDPERLGVLEDIRRQKKRVEAC